MISIADAASRLREGGLVAFPTETVYGLGADATSPDAVARIFAAKGRPLFNPLIAHVADAAAARVEGRFGPQAERLASAFWPGPLTLVLPRAEGGLVCDLACAGLTTIGLRVPSHPLAAALLRAVGRPIAAPSANRSGRLSPTSAQDVTAEFVTAEFMAAESMAVELAAAEFVTAASGTAKLETVVDMILDGGPCLIGIESTIVACPEDAPPSLLRPGGIGRDAIETILGRRLAAPGDGIAAPGMLESHYAPAAALRLEAGALEAGEIGLDFAGRLGRTRRTKDTIVLDLSPRGDLIEAAANLYRHLRALDSLDRRGSIRIAVAPIPTEGLGAAIVDRLRRAAAPRPPLD